MNRLLPITILFVLCVNLAVAQESKLWNEYISSEKKGVETILADYSHAGYRYCESNLPIVNQSTYTFFDVTTFGAIADDGKSDRKAVVLAVNAANKHNGNAVVYFPAGRFNLNSKADFGLEPIVITKSNVVLKGAGQHLTELYFEEPNFIGAQNHIQFVPNYPNESYWRGDNVIGEAVTYPPKGSMSITVNNSGKFKPGMLVNFDADLLPKTERGKAFFTHHNIPAGIKDVEDYFFELHQVDNVVGNIIYFKEPIHLDLPTMTNLKIREIEQVIEECGVEDLTLTGNYQEIFRHHNGARHGERYTMLEFADAKNCWVNNVRFKNYSIAINLHRTIASSFFNINLVGNTGHNSIGGAYSYGNLFAYVRENTQTHHGFGGDHSLVGSVFLRCNQYDGLEAHCAWPRASLYDLNEGGFNPRPGGATFFPHHGKDLCFWNWKVTKSGSNDFWPEGDRYGYFMPFVVAGLYGESFTIEDKDEDLLAYESIGSKIDRVESLFEAQLADRIGTMPTWFKGNSEAYESISRYSSIFIESPADYSYSKSGELTFKFSTQQSFNTTNVQRIELWASTKSIDHGFEKIATLNGWKSELKVETKLKGTVVFKAVMLNSRNELEESKPVTIYLGDPSTLRNLEVVKATSMSHYERNDMYSKFIAKGGGEASAFPHNSAMNNYSNGSFFHDIEVQFYEEQLKTYAKFGQDEMKPLLEKSSNINEAEKLIDGDLSTTIGNIYGYIGSMQEFDLGGAFNLAKVEFDWNESMTSPVKIEVQTSLDSLAWYSVCNDEPLWNFGVQRIGETLSREKLAGTSTKSVIYLPVQRCRYVRFLTQNFPDNKLAEVNFYGSDIALLETLKINGGVPPDWAPHKLEYDLTLETGIEPEFSATSTIDNATITFEEPDSYPGKCMVILTTAEGATTTYVVNISIAGNYKEDFEKLNYSGSYESSFIGNNNIEWWVTARVGNYMDSGNSIYFYPTQNGLVSAPISGGLSEISFQAENYRQSGDRAIAVYVNDSLVIDSTFSAEEIYTVEKKGMHFVGDVVLKIQNKTVETKALGIDNVAWQGYAPDRNVYLNGITLNGELLSNFEYNIYDYHIHWDEEMPEIIADTQSETAKVEIVYPEGLPGFVEIKVVSVDGTWGEYFIYLDPKLSASNVNTQTLFYPNPNGGILKLEGTLSDWNKLKIYNGFGQFVLSYNDISPLYNIGYLSDGLYFLELIGTDGRKHIEKIVKK